MFNENSPRNKLNLLNYYIFVEYFREYYDINKFIIECLKNYWVINSGV